MISALRSTQFTTIETKISVEGAVKGTRNRIKDQPLLAKSIRMVEDRRLKNAR